MTYVRTSTRQRLKEYFLDITESNVGGEQLSSYPSFRIDGAGEYAKMACKIPEGFTEILEAKVVVNPSVTDADGMRVQILFEWGTEGELSGAGGSGGTIYTFVATQAETAFIDIKKELWDDIAAASRLHVGDMLAVQVLYIGASAPYCACSLFVMGFWLKWR